MQPSAQTPRELQAERLSAHRSAMLVTGVEKVPSLALRRGATHGATLLWVQEALAAGQLITVEAHGQQGRRVRPSRDSDASANGTFRWSLPAPTRGWATGRRQSGR